MHEIYLLLGSNLGDREEFLHKAICQIELLVGRLVRASSLYKTESWGISEQPDYINQIILIKSALNAQELLAKILFIEQELGRERFEKWGSRVIDIDILFYGNEVIDVANLTVPHKHFHERRFAVEPMLEIAPNFMHPKLNKTIKSIALELTDQLSVQILNHT